MPSLGMGEIIAVLLIALVVVGPQDLPKIARFLAKCYKYILNLTSEARKALDLDSEIEEFITLKKDIEKSIHDANPVNDIKKQSAEIEKTLHDVQTDIGQINKKIESK